MKNRGFTLIELMTVIVIVGILAAIAYPSYLKSVQKSRRADGRAGIADIQLAQEKLRGNCALYATTIALAENCGARTVPGIIVGGNAFSPEGFYQLSIAGATGNAYTISAVPVVGGPQAGDDCGTLTLTQAGAKGAAAGAVGCW